MPAFQTFWRAGVFHFPCFSHITFYIISPMSSTA